MSGDIKAVIFDMDGVLIDAREWHYEALNMALEPFGLAISREEHLNRFNGLSTKQKLKILTSEKDLPEDLHSAIEEVKQDRTLRLASQHCYPNVAHQILLARLQKIGIRIGLYTNSIRQTTEYMLQYANVYSFLESITTNQDVAKPKPDPEGYLLSCKNLNVNPKDTLVIEDGEYGIQAARAAGCKVLKVNNPEDVNLETLLEEIPGLVS
jgi:beta-phosphoglucomutase